MDNIGLIAHSAYTNALQNQNIRNDTSNVSNVKDAINFQNMVKAEFNQFAKMSQAQTLDYIRNINAHNKTQTTASNSSVIENVARSVRDVLHTQEKTTKKSLINEASMVDIVTTTNEATNTVKLLSEVRNKLFESWEKLMNMSI